MDFSKDAGASPAELPAYWTHPLLDPRLPSRQPAIARLWLTTYRQMRSDPAAYERMVAGYTLPPGGAPDAEVSIEDYFRDADAYLDDLMLLIPERAAKRLALLPETRDLTELLDLLHAAFEERDARGRYEAQRKLYITKLLFDVDHCRSVVDGPRHQRHFDSLLEGPIWSAVASGSTREVLCCLDDSAGAFMLELGESHPAQLPCWSFHLRRLPARPDEPAIDIYDYRSRFKHEATQDISGNHDGHQRLVDTPRWPGLGRRSGSIVSKMIRRSIGNPNMVQDMLGARFIVGHRSQVYALEKRLIDSLGGPWRWRDRVDTLITELDRPRLDSQSSSGFRVLKAIVDVMIDSTDGSYLFPVEIQVFAIEDYLLTLYDAHFASHAAYKQRQFLHELLPVLFPSDIYGSEVTDLDA